MTLENYSLDELKKMAEGMGIDFHHRAGKAKLIELISAGNSGITPPDDEPEEILPEKPAEKPTPPNNVVYSKEVGEVLRALDQHIKNGLYIVHIDNDCFHFRRGDNEDSGTMHQPVRNIVICAEKLMRVR